MVFEFDPIPDGMERFLCPACRYKLLSNHIVQCANCQTIIELLPVPADERPLMLNSKICENCIPKDSPLLNINEEYLIETCA